MNKLFLSIMFLMPGIVCAMAIKDKHIMKMQRDNSQLCVDENGYYVKDNNKTRSIPSYNVDKDIRHANPEQLRAYMKTGFLELKKMSDNDYKIIGHQRGLGGGPILGAIMGVSAGIVGAAATLGATIMAIPATGGASILALPAGGAATVKLVIAATAAGLALPTP